MPRRKPGTLLPLEIEILEVALSLSRSGEPTFHGFGLANAMREQRESRSLTGHGTLYKALNRLEGYGLLSSEWEQQGTQGRPRRRLYELTGAGLRVAEESRTAPSSPAGGRIASEPA